MVADYQPVYSLARGGHPESLHFGAIAVVNARGSLLASLGNQYVPTFLRSAAKPFQALPFVLAGGVEHYGLSTQELALMCASHSGTDEHAAILAVLQGKIGITEGELLCGVHPPYHAATADRMKKAGESLFPNRHNCSGKHTGMLAFAKLRGWPLEDYLDPNHPLQLEIRTIFAELAGLPVDQLALGIDGCSAPIWAAPVYNTALAYARLMDPAGLSPKLQKACIEVREAMVAHPSMVAGPDRFDTSLMQATDGRILSKSGAEGFQGIGLRKGALAAESPAIGIALKIADGDIRGWVSHAVALETLRQLSAISVQELASLITFGPRRMIPNWRGLQVGQGEPVFELDPNHGSG
ncbi:MAG: asparaginase [Anaerolineales bacterium]